LGSREAGKGVGEGFEKAIPIAVGAIAIYVITQRVK